MKKMHVILWLILIVFTISGCQFVSNKNEISGEDSVHQLYEFHNTYIGDATKVRAIVDFANDTEYMVENIELKTDAKPFRLTINFKVENRANYRYIDDNGLNRMSGLIFALVKNADEILYNFYDNYANKDNPDDRFFGSYYTKNNLCERISSDKITVEFIEKSTETIETFAQYYKAIMSVEVAQPDREFLDEVYEFIGEDCEIVVNSAIGAEIELDQHPASDFAIISEQLPHSIGKYQGAGIKAHLLLYDIRNFKTNEIRNCVFLYYTHSDEGVIMIESDFVDRNRYDKILKLIMEAQTQ